MTDIEKRNFFSGLIKKIKGLKSDFSYLKRGIYVGPPQILFHLKEDKRSEEQKLIDKEIETIATSLEYAIKASERLRDLYRTKEVMKLCENVKYDGVLEINGYKYQLVEVAET